MRKRRVGVGCGQANGTVCADRRRAKVGAFEGVQRRSSGADASPSALADAITGAHELALDGAMRHLEPVGDLGVAVTGT